MYCVSHRNSSRLLYYVVRTVHCVLCTVCCVVCRQCVVYCVVYVAAQVAGRCGATRCGHRGPARGAACGAFVRWLHTNGRWTRGCVHAAFVDAPHLRRIIGLITSPQCTRSHPNGTDPNHQTSVCSFLVIYHTVLTPRNRPLSIDLPSSLDCGFWAW